MPAVKRNGPNGAQPEPSRGVTAGWLSRLARVPRRVVTGAACVLALIAFGLVLAACGTGSTTTPTPQTVIGEVAAPPAVKGDAAAGKEVFESAGCKSCHTLADANASGTVGPNLDDAKPSTALVIDRVTNGKGVMPAFSCQLTPEQIADVAAYVSSVAGKS